MNAAMEFVSGRCTNDLFCAVASAGDIVRVPHGARFICSYCGGKLEAATAPRRRIGLRAGAMIGGSMAATGIALFAIGFAIGAPAPRQTAVASPIPAQTIAYSTRPEIAAPVAPPTLGMAPPEAAPPPQPALVNLAMAEASPEKAVHPKAPRARASRVFLPPPPAKQ